MVDKLVYMLELLFIDVVVVKIGNINCGDIVIIDSNVVDIRFIKCVVVIEGDKVKLENNVFFINGEKVMLSVKGYNFYFE